MIVFAPQDTVDRIVKIFVSLAYYGHAFTEGNVFQRGRNELAYVNLHTSNQTAMVPFLIYVIQILAKMAENASFYRTKMTTFVKTV